MSEISALAKALVKAQGKLKNPAMDATNPHFRSKFASLLSVRNAVLSVFNECGLAVVQKPVHFDGGIGINTVILHESGETLDAGTVSIPVAKSDAQAYCSALTYARRYGLQSAAGVVGDPDDDGNGASEPTSEPVKEPTRKPKAKKDAFAEGAAEANDEETTPNYKFLQAMGEEKKRIGDTLYYSILDGYGYKSSKEITARSVQKKVYGEMKMQEAISEQN